MLKKGNKRQLSLDEAKKMKGKTNWSKITEEQKLERTKVNNKTNS